MGNNKIIAYKVFLSRHLPCFSSIKLTALITLLLVGYCSVVANGQQLKQDTLQLTLPQAEQMFLQKNLQLLAQKYNVSATEALIIQAKLYPNPNINVAQGLYNPVNGQWFETDQNGEESVQLSQMIVLSRKIHKQAKVAETNYKLAGDNLSDMLRALKLSMRSSFFNIYYQQQTARVYNEEISSLKTIVNAYKQVQDKGYVSESEIVQVQAQLYSLQNEYQALIDNINDGESQLRLLLQAAPTSYIVPSINAGIVKADPLAYSLNTLLDSANANRPDLVIARDSLQLSQQNYTLQRALAIPDLTAGAGYDRNGSYVRNANFLSLSIDLPIFNRNQGNIKSAKMIVNYSTTQLQYYQNVAQEQINRGLQKAVDADRVYKGVDTTFASNFEKLAKAMVENYSKRNVSLLTFLTFYDSYKQNIVQLNNILYNKVNALENLNYLTASNFFNK